MVGGVDDFIGKTPYQARPVGNPGHCRNWQNIRSGRGYNLEGGGHRGKIYGVGVRAMNSEIRVKTPSVKVYIVIGFTLALVVIVLALTFQAEFSIILYTLAGGVGLSAVVSVTGRFLQIRQAHRLGRLEYDIRVEALNEARVRAQFLIIHHNEMALRVADNGIEVFRSALPAGGQIVDGRAVALPAPLDLLQIMTQPTQSYAIIGGQQVGKTYQAQRLARYWLDNGIKPIVVGPKWDTGEWTGCTLFGGGGNFDKVAQGMRIVRKLAEDRHASLDSHKSHLIQPVFFDDWTAIRAKLGKEAEDFIIDATTLYASVNVVLYFIIHLDTANAWGVGRVGAALHQNFIKLFIDPGFNQAGLIDRTKNTGWLSMPGQAKRDKRAVTLFSGNGQAVMLPEPVDMLTAEERLVSKLRADGLKRSAIANQVFGGDGGNQLRKVDGIISQLDRRER
jgi:hypothetical protein